MKIELQEEIKKTRRLKSKFEEDLQELEAKSEEAIKQKYDI